MGMKFTNNAWGTLAAGITSGAASITLTAGQGARFPSLGTGDYFYAALINSANTIEFIKVTARSTDALTVVRGVDGSTPTAYSAGDRIELRLIKSAVDNTLQLDAANNLTGSVNEAMSTVASAATPDLWTGTGNIINYTGTATATGFASAPQAGARRKLILAAAASFTAGANLLIDGVASGNTWTGTAGDRAEVIALTTTQFRLRPEKQDGTQVVATGAIAAVRNLRVYAHATTPDTRFMVSFDEAVLLDGSNNPLVIRPAGAYECVCTTVGAGGMDAGALGVSTWYYVWAIAKPDGTNNVLLSASATAPTMPTGYTYKALLGVRRTTSASVLERDEQRGATVCKVRGVEDVVFSGAAGVTVWTSQSIASFVPPNATKASLLMGLNTTGTRSIGVRGDPSYGAGSDYGEGASAALDSTFTGRAFKDVVLGAAQTVYWIAQDTGAIYRMVVLDYTLGNVNAN